MNEGPRWVLWMKETGSGKFRANVPLSAGVLKLDVKEAPASLGEKLKTVFQKLVKSSF
jgi:hypothetical protein